MRRRTALSGDGAPGAAVRRRTAPSRDRAGGRRSAPSRDRAGGRRSAPSGDRAGGRRSAPSGGKAGGRGVQCLVVPLRRPAMRRLVAVASRCAGRGAGRRRTIPLRRSAAGRAASLAAVRLGPRRRGRKQEAHPDRSAGNGDHRDRLTQCKPRVLPGAAQDSESLGPNPFRPSHHCGETTRRGWPNLRCRPWGSPLPSAARSGWFISPARRATVVMVSGQGDVNPWAGPALFGWGVACWALAPCLAPRAPSAARESSTARPMTSPTS
jgi:hypothetical protein